MSIRLASAAIATIIGGATFMACGGTSENPLGGPFGGTAQEFIGPTQPPPVLAGSDASVGQTVSPAMPGSSGSSVGSGSGAPNGSSGTASSSSGSGNSSGASASSSGSGAPNGSTSSSGAQPSSSGSSGSGSGSVVGPSSSSGSSSGHMGSSSSSSGSSSGSSGSSGGGMAPTWTYLYMNDLDQKTCNSTPGCHIQWSSASSAYQYLQSSGCLPNMGCLAGFGSPGNMPLFGTLSSTTKADVQAWVAAGSQNN